MSATLPHAALAREQFPPRHRACARAAFLVAPAGATLASETAADNRYMRLDAGYDAARATAQHHNLQRALARELPTLCFPGEPACPDGMFPNNVFGTAQGRLVIGHMRYPGRQAEAQRSDIPRFFSEVLEYTIVDLRTQPGVAELTGALVIDRARGFGWCGLSERCDAAGAQAMQAAFGLHGMHSFALAAGEYHANVVLSVLAGRAVVLCPSAFEDRSVVETLARFYAPHAIVLSEGEKRAFAGNCIALTERSVWLSERAADGLQPHNKAALEQAGFALRSVPLDEIEKAGGSLRCCVAELF